MRSHAVTPHDVTGVLSIVTDGGGYVASLSSPEGEFRLDQFRWDDASGTVSGVFRFTGFAVMLEAALGSDHWQSACSFLIT